MIRRLKLVAAPLVMFGLIGIADTSTADAGGGIYLQVGNGGYGSYGNFGYNQLYQPTYSSYRYGNSYLGAPIYYNNHRRHSGFRNYHPRGPHLDYHGPSLVPHGNHFDLVPGHYDLHIRRGGRGGRHRH